MAELCVIVTTMPEDAAPELVRTLVEAQLVACGNIVPGVTAIYVYRAELCRDREAWVVMETPADRVAAAITRLEALHPYECPKILVLEPTAVNAAYLAWAHANTRPA